MTFSHRRRAGVRTFGWTDEYDTFFGTLVDDHRNPEWPDVVWLAYLEPVRLKRSEYDSAVCEAVRTDLKQIDLDDLDVSDLFPLLWFIEEYWPEAAEQVETGAATEVIDDLRRDAWQRLYSQYDQGNVLADGAGNPGHTPNLEDLTFLDRVIGDAETNLTVLAEIQLEDRISEAHDTLIAEKKSIDDRLITEKRLKLLAGARLLRIGGNTADVAYYAVGAVRIRCGAHFPAEIDESVREVATQSCGCELFRYSLNIVSARFVTHFRLENPGEDALDVRIYGRRVFPVSVREYGTSRVLPDAV